MYFIVWYGMVSYGMEYGMVGKMKIFFLNFLSLQLFSTKKIKMLEKKFTIIVF